MIHIQRPPEPEWWKGSWRGELRKRAKSFFAVPEGARRQERFDWLGMPHKAAPTALLADLFSYKCVYCESLLETSLGGLELHRPRQNAIGTDGEASPDHYWWPYSAMAKQAVAQVLGAFGLSLGHLGP